MKILILSTKMPWPARDGGAIATLNMALGLAHRNCQVTLLTMNTGKHYFPETQLPANLRDQISIRSVNVDTKIRPLRLILNFLFSRYPYNAQRFISKSFKAALEKCLAEHDFDIVQLEGPYLSYYIPSIKGKAKIVLRAHNQEHRIWKLMSKQESNPLKRFYLKTLAMRIEELEKKILSEIDILIPISEADRKGFDQLGHILPVMVIPTGIDISNYPVNKDENRILLFFIGALDWGPNQEGLDWFFREVWPEIRLKWPGLTLDLAGRNPAYYFNSRNLPDNVRLEGEVEDAIEFFHHHSVMIVPLLTGSGIRIKILEAMAMGKTVISTRIGAGGLEAMDGEHLFLADTPAEYVRILENLQTRQDHLQNMGLKARQFVKENFDILVLSEKLISFYKEQLV
ncbi:MAG: glycosyltransferase family 4 protein, partial [Bacteroidales bacterium]|nr:glycosyltransferase family 4 protein [Bacteroidales bacterium]